MRPHVLFWTLSLYTNVVCVAPKISKVHANARQNICNMYFYTARTERLEGQSEGCLIDCTDLETFLVVAIEHNAQPKVYATHRIKIVSIAQCTERGI